MKDEELTLEQYCEKYADIIYVRAQGKSGKWKSYKLSEVEPEEYARQLVRWKTEMRPNWRPYRLLES